MITLRRATATDVKILFDWRNDPGTYRFFYSPEPVAWETHVKWLNGVLIDPERVLLVAEADGMPIATVRFDTLPEADKRAADITVTVAPESRGCGYGSIVLWLATKKALALYGWEVIYAHILHENIASQKAFTKAGYIERSRSETEVVMIAKR